MYGQAARFAIAIFVSKISHPWWCTLTSFQNFSKAQLPCKPIQYACSENEQLGYSDASVSNFIRVSEWNYEVTVESACDKTLLTYFPSSQKNRLAYTLEITPACIGSSLLCAVWDTLIDSFFDHKWHNGWVKFYKGITVACHVKLNSQIWVGASGERFSN